MTKTDLIKKHFKDQTNLSAEYISRAVEKYMIENKIKGFEKGIKAYLDYISIKNDPNTYTYETKELK